MRYPGATVGFGIQRHRTTALGDIPDRLLLESSSLSTSVILILPTFGGHSESAHVSGRNEGGGFWRQVDVTNRRAAAFAVGPKLTFVKTKSSAYAVLVVLHPRFSRPEALKWRTGSAIL